MHRIYLDYNATSIIDEEVRPYLLNSYGNPSSLHTEGQRARHIIESARDNIRRALHAEDAELIFTASGTEANNMVFASFPDYQHLVSAIEHPSVLQAAHTPIIIQVDDQGIVKLNEMHSLVQSLRGKKFIVSVMLANNETGVIQPIADIAKLVKDCGGIMHTDAVQGCGKIVVDMKALGVDMMTVSAHKYGGIVGVGALLFKKDIEVQALIVGGGQEKKIRAGTENVAAIAALDHITNKLPSLIDRMQEIREWRNTLEGEILSICPDVKIFSHDVSRLPNTSCLTMPGVMSEVQVMHFDLHGIALGRGAACSSGLLQEGSHVLRAMEVPTEVGREALRISLGNNSLPKEADRLVKVWNLLYTNR